MTVVSFAQEHAAGRQFAAWAVMECVNIYLVYFSVLRVCICFCICLVILDCIYKVLAFW